MEKRILDVDSLEEKNSSLEKALTYHGLYIHSLSLLLDALSWEGNTISPELHYWI